jgi:GT2 family glycosyltransferase
MSQPDGVVRTDAAPPLLSVAIVLHNPDLALLERTICSLSAATARIDGVTLTLVDHSPHDAPNHDSASLRHDAARWFGSPVAVVEDPVNPGFGAGHNRLLGYVGTYHLVLNPDVEMRPHALEQAIAFMEAHPDCGLIAPAVFGDDGERQYLCKRYPTVTDLVLRAFAPVSLRRRFASRLERYEMRDRIGDGIVWDPPIVSGCFMFFRGKVFEAAGGFDRRFFLYFEDFDLSLRSGRIARTAYVPDVQILHHGGQAARKGFRHIWMFARSGCHFFTKHRWAWY